MIAKNDEQTRKLLNLIRNRSEMLKSLEVEKMKVDNENIGLRLEQKYLFY